VIVYVFIVGTGVFGLIEKGASFPRLTSLALNAVVLMALLLIADGWAMKIGIVAGWLKVVFGAILVLLGLWQVVTLNVLTGIFAMALGLVAGIGLGYWTVIVLQAISSATNSEPT
jgi:hypothetical protein